MMVQQDNDLFVTIVAARYSGIYEGGSWIAFPSRPSRLPEDWDADDGAAFTYFRDHAHQVGLGDTPDEALANLSTKRCSPARPVSTSRIGGETLHQWFITIWTQEWGSTYGSGLWFALTSRPSDLPEEVEEGDFLASTYYRDYSNRIGVGLTPNDALTYLDRKVRPPL